MGDPLVVTALAFLAVIGIGAGSTYLYDRIEASLLAGRGRGVRRGAMPRPRRFGPSPRRGRA